MIVIYYDVGGAHSSCAAANMHIGKLPMDRVPSGKELLSLPTFDKIEKKDIAHLIFIGEDEYKNKVYTISCQRKDKYVLSALKDMYKELTGSTKGLILACTQPAVNILMKIGGCSSRRFHLVSFGRPIVIKGTQKAYFNIRDIVKIAKQNMEHDV